MQTQHSISNYPAAPRASTQPVYSKSCLGIFSTPASMLRFDRFIDDLKVAWKMDRKDFDNVRISLHEALTNAIVHGNKSFNCRLVYIEALRDDHSYTFYVEDEGNGFNYEELRNPVDPENLNKAGGRGIFIMKHLADEISFTKNGRCVKLFFRINK